MGKKYIYYRRFNFIENFEIATVRRIKKDKKNSKI